METPTPYRQHLKAKLAARQAARPGYSMRAFARDLSYGPSQLSRVINGKQHLSLPSARLISERLFESEADREYFLAQVEVESAPTPSLRQAARVKLEQLKDAQSEERLLKLEQDAFQVISDWYHFPILDLMTFHQPPNTGKSVAEFLGISRAEAELAIERLMRMGMLKRESDRWHKVHSNVVVPSGAPKTGVRKFHRSMICKALEAIEGQDIDRRYLSAYTIALAPKDLPKLKTSIDDFLKKVSELSARSRPKSRLYQMNVQLFDLETNRRNK